jgi:hypothetical protein
MLDHLLAKPQMRQTNLRFLKNPTDGNKFVSEIPVAIWYIWLGLTSHGKESERDSDTRFSTLGFFH